MILFDFTYYYNSKILFTIPTAWFYLQRAGDLFAVIFHLGFKGGIKLIIGSIAKAFGVSYERLFKSNTIENKDILYALRLLEKDLTAAITEEIHNKFENLDV